MRHFAHSFRFDNLGALSRSASAMRVGRRVLAAVLLTGMSLVTAPLAGPIERFQVNLPPETVLSSGPPDSTDSTNYRVHFYWTGADPDGEISHFDFIMVDHPRSNDSIGPGGMNPVIVTVPAPDDPRWTSTTLIDSIFVTSADTLRRDPRPSGGESPADVLQHPFERWHSFFVRAVDNLGLPDPTPDYRSFNSKNLAPTVALRPPVLAGLNEFTAPPSIVFHFWYGEDPVDESTTIEPVASRWVIISTKFSISGTGDPYVSFPESLYVLPSRYEWSPWRAWDAEDGSGKRAAVSGLLRVGEAPGSGYYLFAVQTMDEAGAITPVFDYRTPGKNNCVRVRVTGVAGPLLTVRENTLGTAVFVGGSTPVEIEVGAEQPVSFRWSADGSHYGGTITGYRYGWDILNPENDEEWSSWSVDNTSAPTRAFSGGTHLLSVQARDDLQQLVTATFWLEMHHVTMGRDILWVDDSDHLTDAVTESFESSRWISVLSTLAQTAGLEFDSAVDVYDVQMDELQRPPSLDLLLDHKVVVWSVRAGAAGSSGLRRTAQFFDPIPSRNQNTARNFNALKVYVANGGRLWINGFEPAGQLWPDERDFRTATLAVNVTNWDDPLEPHPPGVDSVGTTSLLYKMGIEVFDLGASLGFPRFRSQHFCYGLRAAGPGVPELQVSAAWSQGGTGGRVNVEICDMPLALADQHPPLVPPDGKTRVLYTYVSGVPESESITYPETADHQPMFVVTKTALDDMHHSLALCGFEPYLLESNSHVDLARHVLAEMGLVPDPVFLRSFTAAFTGGAVRIEWQLDDSSDPAEFLLRGRAGDTEWTVPFAALGANTFGATDESPHLSRGKTVIYSLYAREGDSPWVVLGQETVVLTEAPPKLQLLSPHPNPFNPRVEIPFVLPAAQRVRVSIYAADGRKITTLVDALQPAGPGSVVWDGTDASGHAAASGLYIARLESGGELLSRKLVLMK